MSLTTYSPWLVSVTTAGGGEEDPRPAGPPRIRATFRLEVLIGEVVEGEAAFVLSEDGSDLLDELGADVLTDDSEEVGGESGWVDLTTDVLVASGVRWRRGINGSGPEDRVASIGTLEFSLFNDIKPDGSGLPGYYSPWHANCRDGWRVDIPVRLIAVYAGNDYPLWRGVVSSILPVPGVNGRRAVLVTGVGVMARWAETTIPGIPENTDGHIDALVQAISDAAPAPPLWIDDPSDGELVSLDTSSDRMPYAFIDMGGGQYALGLLQNVMQSALAFAYEAKDGTFTTENRHRRALRSSVLSLDDTTIPAGADNVQVPSSHEGVFNILRATVHHGTPGADVDTVLFSSPGVLFVEPGQTLKVWGTYADPTNTLKLLGGTDLQVPIASDVDYAGNAAEDGSGSDLTSDLAITTTPYFTSVLFEIENTGAARVYLVNTAGEPFPRIRGRAISDDGPTTIQSDPVAVDYADRDEVLDLPYMGDVNFAKSYANYLVAQYANPVQIHGVALNPQLSADMMIACLGLEIGDVIDVTETMTGLDGTEAYIQSISGEFRSHFWLSMRLGLAPRNATGEAWTLGTSQLGITTVLGF